MSNRVAFDGLSKSIAVVLTGLFLTACASAPPEVEKISSVMLAQPQHTQLGSSVAGLRIAHPNQSGHVVLDTGREAFQARVALAASAQHTLDAQYYIWNDDTTGRILARKVLAAADSGVRIRLLLDDYGIGNKDTQLAALDTHDRIEVRVYNPVNAGFRSGVRKWANLALGFSRLNRRMHSKTFIVDNSVAITGGRNIGNEYFDANKSVNHRDRDMLSIGPVVEEISSQFDVMWNSQWSIPIHALSGGTITDKQIQQRYRSLELTSDADNNALYPLPLALHERERLVQSFLGKAIWAPTRFIYNPPAITGGDEDGGAVVTDTLVQLLAGARTEVLVESAYFTIMDGMLTQLAPYLESSVSIKVLTNSLATTDVWTIHAGYTRNRKELLRRGVQLYEWRGDGKSCAEVIDNDQLDCGTFLYSLHAKSVVFDRETIFVGSFNLNPRSHLLNTETALIVTSKVLAHRVAANISRNLEPQNSWRLAIDSDGALSWHGVTQGKAQTIDHEPHTTKMTRFKSALAALLPLEKYW